MAGSPFFVLSPWEQPALIEAAMLVALGFLAAALMALSVLPALTRRADRLARKRAEAAFPLSLAEIAADRDHLRAELATRERVLERRAESGFAARAGAMGEVGRRDMTIAAIERDLAERESHIAAIEGELESTRQELAETRQDLARESAGHLASQETLSLRIADLAALEHRLAETRQELTGTGADLAARDQELEALRDRQARLEAVLAERDQALAALRVEQNVQKLALVEAGTTRLTLEMRGEDLSTRLKASEAALEQTRKALAAMTVDRDSERLRADAVSSRAAEAEAARAASDAHAAGLGVEIVRHEQAEKQMQVALAEAQARLDALEARAEALALQLEGERTRRAEELLAQRQTLREREEAIEALHAEVLTMQGARDQARADREGLKRENAALRREAGAAGKGGSGEGEAALRQEIVKLADLLLAATDERAAAE